MRIQILTAALLCTSSMVHAGTVSLVDNGQFGEFRASGSLDVSERLEPVVFDDSDDAPNSEVEIFLGLDVGVYDVSNNTGGNLMGFGVSNNFTLPAIFDESGLPGPIGCTDAPGYQTCYSIRELNANNWDDEIAFAQFELVEFAEPELNAPTVANVQMFEDDVPMDEFIDFPAQGIFKFVEYSFQDVFGDFEDVAGEDRMFNWFDAIEGEIFNPRPPVAQLTTLDVIDETMELYEIETALAGPLADGDSLDDFFGFLAGIPRSSIIGVSATQNGTSFFTAGQATISAVPLPAAAWMLMAGIGGLGAIARRKKV